MRVYGTTDDSNPRPGMPLLAAPVCAVCAAPLPTRVAFLGMPTERYPVCRTVVCRMVVDKRATMAEPEFRQYLSFQARFVREVKKNARLQQERAETELTENSATWDVIRALSPAGAIDDFLPLVLPSGPRRPIRVAPVRREAYREHLRKIIAEAATATSPATKPASTQYEAGTTALSAHLCEMCGGGCCVRGGDTAYLAADTIRRYMAQHPLLQPEEVLLAYMARLADHTEAESCINHTVKGCGLSREMRSDTCNDYMCPSLIEVQRERPDSSLLKGVITIRRQRDQWARSELAVDNSITGLAVITDVGIFELPLRKSDSAAGAHQDKAKSRRCSKPG